MQPSEKPKQTVKPLETHYRPLGISAVLAAALMAKAGKKAPKAA